MSDGDSGKKKVLFVCIGNMIRSQIAEGFARHGGSAFIETYSAGVKPAGVVSEEAVTVMREKGCSRLRACTAGMAITLSPSQLGL